MNPPPSFSPEEARLMETLALAFEAVAEEMFKKTPADVPLMASALNFAATRMLFRDAPNPVAALNAAQILARAGVKSMADMLCGSDAHQVTQ